MADTAKRPLEEDAPTNGAIVEVKRPRTDGGDIVASKPIKEVVCEVFFALLCLPGLLPSLIILYRTINYFKAIAGP